MTTNSTTATTEPTWASLIARCTPHLLTITNRGTLPDTATTDEPLTPGQFTDLVHEAIETLETLPGLAFRGGADVLHVAHIYLADALSPARTDNTESIALRLAAQHLSDVADIARDVRHG